MTLAEMPFVTPDLRLASAEIFVLAMSCLLLIVDLFVKDRKRTVVFALTQLTLLVAAVLSWKTGTEQVMYTFSKMYVSDLLASVSKIMVFVVVFATLCYSRRYVLDRPNLAKGEFYVLVLLATLGMMVMISANHFVTVYVGIELLSLSLYALVAMNRDSVAATEAGMKYFVLGALASGLLLYGMSMIYGATGSLEITTIAQQVASGQAHKAVLGLGLVFLIAGIGFKLGVVPFHMWIPDVYHGAPTVVTLFIGSAPKLAAFAVVFRLLVSGLIYVWQAWQPMLLILALLSMAVGNFAAVAQTNLKRMLAYSAISHMGFMLLALSSGISKGYGIFALDAYMAAMFYVVTYVLTSAGAFGVILLLTRSGFEAEQISDFAGLNKRSPWLAFIMLMLMFSMAGVPFFVGFFAKFTVLRSVIAIGNIWVAIAAVFFSLVGAFYYLRVVKVMYFDVANDHARIEAPFGAKLLVSVNGLAVAALGLFPHPLMQQCGVSLFRALGGGA